MGGFGKIIADYNSVPVDKLLPGDVAFDFLKQLSTEAWFKNDKDAAKAKLDFTSKNRKTWFVRKDPVTLKRRPKRGSAVQPIQRRRSGTRKDGTVTGAMKTSEHRSPRRKRRNSKNQPRKGSKGGKPSEGPP